MEVTARGTARNLARSSMDTRMSFASGSGQVSVGGLRMQSRVQPGTRMTAKASVTNHAQYIVGDNDQCDAGFFQKGYQIDMELLVDGELVDNISNCVKGMGGTLDVEFEFLAPTSSGSHTVEVRAVGGSTGNVGDSTQQTLTIDENAPPEENPDDDNGGGNAVLPCFLDPNRACSARETLMFAGIGGAIGLVLLIAVMP